MNIFTVLLIRGLVGIAAGTVAFLWPGLTMAFLVVLFGAYAFIDGVTNIVLSVRRAEPGHRASWGVFAQGLVGIVAGVLMFLFPPAAVFALVFLIAAWALVTGVLEIGAAITLRREIKGEWMLALSGVLSIIFAIVLFLSPAIGIVAIAWILGVYAAASGILLAALAMRMRMLTRRPVGA